MQSHVDFICNTDLGGRQVPEAKTQITVTVKLHNADGAQAECSTTQEYYIGDAPSGDLEKLAKLEVQGLEVGLAVLRDQRNAMLANATPHYPSRQERRRRNSGRTNGR